jgi:hypothetical protein
VSGVAVAVGGLPESFDLVALIWAPPVLVATPLGADAVVVEPAVSVFMVFGDDEVDGSAHALPWLANRATPTPSATTRQPTRTRPYAGNDTAPPRWCPENLRTGGWKAEAVAQTI